MVYMITYDLNSHGQKYDELIEAIKNSSENWCTFWKSSYLIKSTLSLTQVESRLTPHLDPNDRLIILEVTNNYGGWLLEEQWKYIREDIFN